MAKQENDLIEQYLAKQLEGGALRAFQLRLEQEPALAQEVQDRQAMVDFLLNLEKTKAFKAKLEALGVEHFSTENPAPLAEQIATPVPASRKKSYWPLLVLVLGLITAFFIYQKIFNQPAAMPTYGPVAMHERLELVQKDNAADAATIYKFSELYNQGNYQQALPLLENYLSTAPDDMELQIARGVCLLELDQLASAREVFERVARGSSIYRHTGTWYLALSYLKVGQLEKMREYLKRIPESAEMYYEQAQRLLEA